MICLPYYSGAGHTALLAGAIAQGAAEAGCKARPIDVTQMTDADWTALDAASAIVFGAPTYMGSTAARFDQFLEAASTLRWETAQWRDKLAGGFTVAVHANGDKGATLQRMATYAAQMGMIWVGQAEIGGPVYPEQGQINTHGSWTGLTATSTLTQPDLLPQGDIETAQRYGARLAMAVARWTQ